MLIIVCHKPDSVDRESASEAKERRTKDRDKDKDKVDGQEGGDGRRGLHQPQPAPMHLR